MHLAALQLGQLGQGQLGGHASGGAHGQGDQHLVRVETGVVAAQILHLQLLDGLDGMGRDHMLLMVDAGQLLQGVQKQSGGGAQEIRGFAGDNPAVLQFHGGGGGSGGFGPIQGSVYHPAVVGGGVGLLHQQLDLESLLIGAGAVLETIQGRVVPADDLLAGSLPAGLVVHDAVSGHVDAHICGRFVRALPEDFFKNSVQHREDLHIPIIVHRRLPVSFQMEGIDHVDIVQICGGRLVGQVDGVL